MPMLAAENPATAPAPKKGAAGGKSSGAEKPSIVLVHGAFLDGTSWQEVIPLLQKSGYEVTAVQLPLTSYEDDMAFAKRVIDAQKGQVVVAGHSWGGAVMTGAAAGNKNVKGLVYIAAFAPDNGETPNQLTAKFPKTQLGDALMPDQAGFLYVDRAKFRNIFAQDVPEKVTAVIAATQKPIINKAFDAVSKEPAWKSAPSWFLITAEDHALNPDLQRFEAKRMSAHITEVKSSHAVLISKPKEVAKIIESAAKEEVAMGNPE
jgi:pimeloyl-ACP methyl ester carboxylesterase